MTVLPSPRRVGVIDVTRIYFPIFLERKLLKISRDIFALYFPKYSRYFSSKKHELIQYGSYLENLIEDEPFKARKDNYNNEFYNYLDSGIKKTRCTFNLLKLYKPGELLSSVSNV